jgi:ketosteroid isomerase-like protein
MSSNSKIQLGKEHPPHTEEVYISQMVRDLFGQLEKLYAPGNTERQAHPKQHGLVAAEFIIEPNLPDHLKVGVFAEAKTFPAWVRLSNASTKPKDDSKKDTRGFAIKLMDVPGEKLIIDRTNDDTQDFLMVSSPSFFAKDLKEMAGVIKAICSDKLLRYFLNPLHWGTLMRVSKELIKVNNILQIPYWSTVPYQFGKLDQAVKYHVKPVSPKQDPKPSDPTGWFLRDRLIKDLSEGEVWYDFMIQFQEDPVKMPIEDPRVEWTSPFIKVASIRILQQKFDTEHQLNYGQKLSFNPWHSLPAHRPIGCFNRARRIVYNADSKFRLKRDGIVPPEVVPPSEFMKDNTPIDKNTDPPKTSQSMTNKEVMEEMLAAYGKKDLAAVMGFMSDDVTWFTQGDKTAIPYAGTYTGKEAVTGYFELEAKLITATTFTPTGMIGGDNDAQQVFTAHEIVKVNATGKSYETDFAMIFTLENGLVTKVTSLMDTLAVAKAFE